MKNNSQIEYLDLYKKNLYGWEGQKGKKNVENIQNAIRNEEYIDPVHVYQIDNSNYQLDPTSFDNDLKKKDGGHTRAIAYYREKKPLPVIINGHLTDIDVGDFKKPIHIKDIKIVEKSTIERYKELNKKI